MAFFNTSSGGENIRKILTLGSLQQVYKTSNRHATWRPLLRNTLAAFTTPLAQRIDLGSSDDWEVGITEFTCPSIIAGTYARVVTIIGDNNVLIYCDLISPQIVDCNLVRCLRTYVSQTVDCQHIFTNIYYVPVEKRQFQDIRIEILTTKGKRFAFKDSDKPVKVVLHFRRIRV